MIVTLSAATQRSIQRLNVVGSRMEISILTALVERTSARVSTFRLRERKWNGFAEKTKKDGRRSHCESET
jgi:hypothetical protein